MYPRMPLPTGVVGDEQPTFVNRKQYERILKRREARAKLDAKRKIIAERPVQDHISTQIYSSL